MYGGGVTLLLSISLYIVSAKSGWVKGKMAQLGWVELKDSERSDYWTVTSWTSMLWQLDYEADVCFFGNSITRGGNFKDYFEDKKVVNLGYTGDQLHRMLMRVEQIKVVNPKKVFVMAGINDLKYSSVEQFSEKYGRLVDSIRSACPNSEIYLQSVLPIRKERCRGRYTNENIVRFNEQIARIAEKRHLTYIDLHSLYFDGNELKKECSKDGLHLQKSAYCLWVAEIEKYIE